MDVLKSLLKSTFVQKTTVFLATIAVISSTLRTELLAGEFEPVINSLIPHTIGVDTSSIPEKFAFAILSEFEQSSEEESQENRTRFGIDPTLGGFVETTHLQLSGAIFAWGSAEKCNHLQRWLIAACGKRAPPLTSIQ